MREKLCENIHCPGLFFPHHFRFLVALIFITTQVQNTVRQHPQQLLRKFNFENPRILSHPLHTNVNVTVQNTILHIIKRDNVGERVVRQILQIQFQQIVVIAKNVVQVPYPETFRLRNGLHPLLVLQLFLYQYP